MKIICVQRVITLLHNCCHLFNESRGYVFLETGLLPMTDDSKSHVVRRRLPRVCRFKVTHAKTEYNPSKSSNELVTRRNVNISY